MFYVRTAWRNLCRYRVKTMLHIGICMAVVLFLHVYGGSLEKAGEQLAAMQEKIPVEASVVNLAGGMESGLFIKEALYEGVMKSDKAAEPKFTLQLITMWDGMEKAVLVVNTWKAVPGASEKMFRMETGTPDAFFGGSEKQCLVTEAFLEENQLKTGDEIPLELLCYRLSDKDYYSLYAEPLETLTCRIVGTVTVEEAVDAETIRLPEILLPMETVRESFRRQEKEFFTDSGAFYVKNLLELNAFKKEMKDIGFLEILPKANPAKQGNALVVKDETFIRAAGSSEEGYRMMRSFLPVAAVVLASAGFIISYLLTGGRRQEYAVMRSLGMEKKACTAVYLVEHGAAQITGGILGSVAAVLLDGTDVVRLVLCFGAFLVCFFAGTLAALLALGKISVMEILTKAE